MADDNKDNDRTPSQAGNAELFARLFLRELDVNKIRLLEQHEGTNDFVLEVRGQPVTVSLDELTYDFERDADPQLVVRFIGSLLEVEGSLPEWTKARSRLFLSVEAIREGAKDLLAAEVSKLLALTVVHAGNDDRRLTSVTRSQVAAWHVTEAEVMQAAKQNLANLVDETPLEVRTIGTLTTATFASRSFFKPAFVFSENLKQKVIRQLGWPVLAMLPCREDTFLVPANFLEKEAEETQKLLNFVIQEFLESRQSLTPELLRISDDGVEALAYSP